LVWQGRLDECITAAQNSISVAESAYVGEIPDAIVRSAMWLAMWLKGQHTEAYAEVKKALEKFAKASVVDYSAYLIHAQLAEVAFLAFAQSQVDPLPAGQTGETGKYAKQAIKNLKKYSGIFAIGEPALNRFSAELEWQAGKQEKAYAFWRRAAAKAQALPMCYELGRAELALGQHLPVDDPARAAHLEKARQTFQQGGLENWAAIAKEALEVD
jgi:tetratricopeptide (TPR) repeat protein